MDLSLFLASAVASAFATLLFVPWLIRNLRGTTLVGKDLNKPNHPIVPEMGGVGVMLGFSVGVTMITVLATAETLAAVSVYYYVAISAALGAGVVGLLDDMFHLRQRTKAVIPFVLALPLGAVVFATGDVYLLGWNVGLATLIAVPFGVTSAANAANMLEGYNGLGARALPRFAVYGEALGHARRQAARPSDFHGSAKLNERGRDFVQKIFRQAQRTHRVVQSLLDFSRQRKPLKESVVEVEYSAGFFRFCTQQMEQLQPRDMPERIRNMRWTVHHRPAGVVGLITPWRSLPVKTATLRRSVSG